MHDLGFILKNLRAEAGYTQQQIAYRMEVSVTTVGRWENNYKMPSLQKLLTLSAFYNVPLDYLVGIEKERSIVINRLTREQQNLLNTLVLEFQNKRRGKGGLTARQQDILNLLLVEFNGGKKV